MAIARAMSAAVSSKCRSPRRTRISSPRCPARIEAVDRKEKGPGERSPGPFFMPSESGSAELRGRQRLQVLLVARAVMLDDLRRADRAEAKRFLEAPALGLA